MSAWSPSTTAVMAWMMSGSLQLLAPTERCSPRGHGVHGLDVERLLAVPAAMPHCVWSRSGGTPARRTGVSAAGERDRCAGRRSRRRVDRGRRVGVDDGHPDARAVDAVGHRTVGPVGLAELRWVPPAGRPRQRVRVAAPVAGQARGVLLVPPVRAGRAVRTPGGRGGGRGRRPPRVRRLRRHRRRGSGGRMPLSARSRRPRRDQVRRDGGLGGVDAPLSAVGLDGDQPTAKAASTWAAVPSAAT